MTPSSSLTDSIMAMMANMASPIEVHRLATALGSDIRGLDLTAPISDEDWKVVHETFLESGVICIRGQAAMRPEDQLEFATRWGEISIHPYIPSIEGHPGIMKIYDPNPITQTWHADTTHMKQPPAVTILLARVLPPVGGDTMFASASGAYESLSPAMRSTLDGLQAVHHGTERSADAGLDAAAVTAVHPVVRTHPETGARSIFVNDNYVSNFEGWTAEESAPLLSYLYQVIGRPENTYRHRWQHGDMIIWDNRCTQHSVVADTAGAERVLHRITIAGDTPR